MSKNKNTSKSTLPASTDAQSEFADAPGTDALHASPLPASPDNPDAILEENIALKEENEALHRKITLLEAAIEELAATTAIPGTKKTGHLAAIKAAAAQNEPFEVDGKMYTLTVAELSIRKIGKRTALDIISDDEPLPQLGNKTIKEWLVANNSSAIKPLN
jgi:hypothetical protein